MQDNLHILKGLLFIIALSFMLGIALTVHAEDSIDITVDKEEITLSGSVRLDITFYGVENMPAPQLPTIDGLESTHLRSANIVSRVDGGTLRSTRHTYVLMPKEAGVFKIGPFNFVYDEKTYTTKGLSIKVLAGTVPERKEEAGLTKEAEFKARENAFLVIEIEKDKVYLNEVLPASVSFYFKDIYPTDIELPLLVHEGFSLGEFRSPVKSKKSIKGSYYNAIYFRNRIFATSIGELTLGPATLNCNLQVRRLDILRPSEKYDETLSRLGKYTRGDVFEKDVLKEAAEEYRKQPFRFESATKRITVMPLPEEARPEDFTGSVGDFNFTLKAEPQTPVKTGDAITLLMEITGKGNMDIVSPPAIKETEDFILYPASIKEESQTHKIFEQVLIPKTSAFRQIPQLRFSFFNPEQTTYKTITQGPIPITVIKAEEPKKVEVIEQPAETVKVLPKEEVGRDIIYIKDSPGKVRSRGAYLYKNRAFIIFQTAPLILYACTLLLYRRYERLRTDIAYARHRIAYRKAKKSLDRNRLFISADRPSEFYNSLFNTMQEYFGDKFNLPSGGITADIVDGLLKPKGFQASVLDKVKKFFTECDIAKFTPAQYQKKGMMAILGEAGDIIEYFKKA